MHILIAMSGHRSTIAPYTASGLPAAKIIPELALGGEAALQLGTRMAEIVLAPARQAFDRSDHFFRPVAMRISKPSSDVRLAGVSEQAKRELFLQREVFQQACVEFRVLVDERDGDIVFVKWLKAEADCHGHNLHRSVRRPRLDAPITGAQFTDGFLARPHEPDVGIVPAQDPAGDFPVIAQWQQTSAPNSGAAPQFVQEFEFIHTSILAAHFPSWDP